jgi:PAS domain S-box-containing protein
MDTSGVDRSPQALLAEIDRLQKRVSTLELEKAVTNSQPEPSPAQDFKALVENTPDIISRHDKEFRHIYVNPAIEQVAGIPAAQFIGKTHQELGMPPDTVRIWNRAVQQVFETAHPVIIEFDFVTPEGPRHYQSRLVPEFGPDGQLETVLSIARDITDLKQFDQQLSITQEQLRQSQEQLLQARKLESIGRLAGGIAHDFNNLLTAISGYSDLMLLSLDEADPLWADVQEILKASNRAAQLTHQLLAFSRRQVLQPKILNINTVVTDISRMLTRLIG